MASLSLAGVDLFERPESTVLKLFRQLFRDERNAAIFCFGATALVYWLLANVFGVDVENSKSVFLTVALILAGPVLEKGGFFHAYSWAASKKCLKEYQGGRFGKMLFCFRIPFKGKFWRYFRTELREQHFWRVLRADILYHDSFYCLFMFLLTRIVSPQEVTGSFYFVPYDTALSGLFGAIAFSLALMMAVICEARYVEWAFRRFLKKLGAQGGKLEHYGELRYLVEGEQKVLDSFLPKVRKLMRLEDDVHRQHQDWIVEGTSLRTYNEWKGFMQLREAPEGSKLHVVYYRTRMIPPSDNSISSVVYVEKIKVAIPIEEMSESCIRSCLGKLARKILTKEVKITTLFSYERVYASRPEAISFALDRIKGIAENGLRQALVEIKFWLAAKSEVAEAHLRTICRPWRVLPTTQPRSLTPQMLADLERF